MDRAAVPRASRVELTDDTALWYHTGKPPVLLRWVLRPRSGWPLRAAGLLLSTDAGVGAEQIVAAFVRRWAMGTTFQEAHAHLGLEGQRQWSDLAVARSTPARLALFSVVALVVEGGGKLSTRQASWYAKTHPTSADALAHVRRLLWRQTGLCLSAAASESRKPAGILFAHLTELLCYAA